MKCGSFKQKITFIFFHTNNYNGLTCTINYSLRHKPLFLIKRKDTQSCKGVIN